MKQYKVYQTISIFNDAENETEAIDKVREEPSTYEGWNKWEIENVDDIPNDIIDFYPPIVKNKCNKI